MSQEVSCSFISSDAIFGRRSSVVDIITLEFSAHLFPPKKENAFCILHFASHPGFDRWRCFGVQVRRVLKGVQVKTRHLKRTVRIAGLTDLPMERLRYHQTAPPPPPLPASLPSHQAGLGLGRLGWSASRWRAKTGR